MTIAHLTTMVDEGDDPRVVVLREAVAQALGPYADRSTLTVPQTAEVLGIGRSACYEACRRGEVPSLRVAGRVVVPAPALAALLLGRDETRALAPAPVDDGHRGRPRSGLPAE